MGAGNAMQSFVYPLAWLPRSAKHHGQKVTRLSDFKNKHFANRPYILVPGIVLFCDILFMTVR